MKYNEIHSFSLQVLCSVEVSQDESGYSIFHRDVAAQGILTHDLQALQGILTAAANKPVAIEWLWRCGAFPV